MAVRYFFGDKVRKVDKVLPYVAIFSISFIIATIFAINVDVIKKVSPLIVLVVLLHNLLGFVLGYAFGVLVGLDRKRAKTLSIEVGLQDTFRNIQPVPKRIRRFNLPFLQKTLSPFPLF